MAAFWRGTLILPIFLIAKEEQIVAPSPVIKFLPFALVVPFQNTLHVGIEFPMGLENSIQVEGGWVFGSLDKLSSYEFSQQGLKLRLSWREYFGSRKVRNRPSSILEGGYFALMGSYQHYFQTFERVDTSGGYGYFPEYDRTIQAFEVAFLLGYQVQLGRWLSIDFWGGLGARYSIHRWSPTKPPASASLSFYLNSGGDTAVGDLILLPGARPVPRLGIAIGWILR
jgi:hypothetical protein